MKRMFTRNQISEIAEGEIESSSKLGLKWYRHQLGFVDEDGNCDLFITSPKYLAYSIEQGGGEICNAILDNFGAYIATGDNNFYKVLSAGLDGDTGINLLVCSAYAEDTTIQIITITLSTYRGDNFSEVLPVGD